MQKNQLAGLMKQAQQMQENMKKVQEQLAAHRQPARNARDLQAAGSQGLADVVRGGLPFHGEIGGKDDFPHHPVGRAPEQPVEMDFLRADAVERRERAHQHEIKALVALGLLHHQQVARRLDHAKQGRIAAR